MLVIPAIDLKDGQAVRLFKGDYQQKTVYSDHPEELAQTFEEAGAKLLHVVDLDGAKDGQAKNLETIKKIRKQTSMKIELGGGIRDLKTALKRYGSEKVVVGVDVKNGFVSTAGWLETSQTPYLEFIHFLEKIGVQYIVATDISKDGTLMGPNFDMYDQIAKTSSIQFVVSGGIKDFDNIKKVAEKGYYACIVGKAYYEKKVDLKETIQCLQNV